MFLVYSYYTQFLNINKYGVLQVPVQNARGLLKIIDNYNFYLQALWLLWMKGFLIKAEEK